MAPTGKQAHSNNNDTKSESILQAVVLADAAELRFRPLTLTKPRVHLIVIQSRLMLQCLLPLANVPLIEYTLEFLAVAGVEEIFVFCKSHADQVKAYLASSKWGKPKGSLKIHTIVAPDATSVGDVLRQLDAKSLIHTDFILVSGDVVSNMKLDAVLEEHRARRAENKDAIMTMVMKRASPQHRSRAKGESAVVVLDPKNSECLHYDVLQAFPPAKKIQLDLELFKKHPTLQFRNDLIDCQIDICSVEVPALFTENFDYQDMRRDFVRGILTSDLLGKSIHTHILGEEYAARVRSTQMYDAISRDVIGRWTFPMVPDSNIFDSHTYRYYRNHIYKESSVVLSRSCVIDRAVVIGAETTVGENTRITQSTIGRNCRIGSNVVIDGAYIWDNVTIGDNCVVVKCIVADGAMLLNNVTIEHGCVLGDNVAVGPNVVLPPFTKLTTHPMPDDAQVQIPVVDVGANGNANVWLDSFEEDWDEEEDARNRQVWQLGFDSATVPQSAEASSSSSDSNFSDDDDGEETEDEQVKHAREIEDTVRRAIAESHTVDNAALELNALKLACNITFRDLRLSSIPTIVVHIDVATAVESTKKMFQKWGPLIGRFVHSEHDQIDALWILLDACVRDVNTGAKLFRSAVTTLYEQDVIEEDAILRWYNSSDRWALLDDQRRAIRSFMTVFINWLEESDSEESEEDSDDE